MGRQQFKADLVSASQKVANGDVIGVTSIARGESDGELVISFQHESLPGRIRVQALVQDVSEYPGNSMFMLFTDDEQPPKAVMDTLSSLQDYALGLSIYELTLELAGCLNRALRSHRATPDDVEMTDFSDTAEDEFDFTDDAYEANDAEFGLAASSDTATLRNSLSRDQELVRQRMKRDFQQVRREGFRVGLLNDPSQPAAAQGMVSISIRVNRLALPEEAMEAWGVQDSDYLVLLICYGDRYKTLENITDRPAALSQISFRVGKCERYKPSKEQAFAAFADAKHNPPAKDDDTRQTSGRDEFRKMFVSNSLDQFLNQSFISLMKIRNGAGCSWEEANDQFLEMTGQGASRKSEDDAPVDKDGSTLLEPILTKDHLTQQSPGHDRSFPLVAMQFTLWYFARCTEYCLRCHRKLEKGFQALRPYVCSDPLCMFQYVTMGLGPCLEHEIFTEPYVVDLLVSLCYASIQHASAFPSNVPGGSISTVWPIRTFPVGLQLKVPDLRLGRSKHIRGLKCGNRLTLTSEDDFGNLRLDRWIAFRIVFDNGIMPGPLQHAVIKTMNNATRSIEVEHVSASGENWHVTLREITARDGKVEIFPYELDFDALTDEDKAITMRHILDTLPSILDIEAYLSVRPHGTVRSMNGVSPAAGALLQWIVSSNRSCIYQVDRSRNLSDQTTGPAPAATTSTSTLDTAATATPAGRGRDRDHERIPEMDDWIQFRFAQGSPDKELRFNKALQEVAARRKMSRNPTIFAWHGSHLANWHSILRTGLDFQDVRTGRSFGNGVYFSRQLVVSRVYAGGQSSLHVWPNSHIRPYTCVSLNEIINAPAEFVSQNPHYVVSQPDWHQCRYLFVQSQKGRVNKPPAVPTSAETAEKAKKAEKPGKQVRQHYHKQAQDLEVLDETDKPLRIPLVAVPVRHVGQAEKSATAPKRLMRILDDSSEEEEAVDIEFLSSDSDEAGNEVRVPVAEKAMSHASDCESTIVVAADDGSDVTPPLSPCRVDTAATDFRPGTLDLDSLPHLEPPSWATDMATKALAREIRQMQAIQSKSKLHELGWYMDFNNVSNLYQWIVELHSFDATLPLARDMKAAGVSSLVLELRFGRDFPMAPPFVRVIRPRFLPFAEGGGGHVTAGGAMCMELLTNTGWLPSFSMENVLVQIRFALCSLEPRPARLARGKGYGDNCGRDYGVAEAIDAYIRAAAAHGWKVPEDLHVTARGV